MPVPLRTAYHKAEAKYNVITEFPSLGLHSAAATGNVGLVEYALDHGQPINSVLDGVLPLHAACAGGHVQVVKLLIEHGADVNAPRLPRRYFNDKNRDSSAPIVGTSGSTPLHFAAANGNTDVVTLLLHHGAHADRADKHGVTPEMLAQENNWLECAQVLHSWIINKDRDLREREGLVGRDSGGVGVVSTSSHTSREQNASVMTDIDFSPSSRTRLHVKHSIDTALNMLKSSSSGHSDIHLRPNPSVLTASPPSSPLKPFGEYTFVPDVDDRSSPIDPASRRPSLPHILQPTPPLLADETSRRKATTPLPTTPKQRRPRSAGHGADRPQEQELTYVPYGRGGSGRKVGSKISLLGLFKKAQHGETTESNGPQPSSVVPSPSPGSTTNLPLSNSPNISSTSHPSQSSNIDLNDNSDQTTGSTSNMLPSHSGLRLHKVSDASSKGRSFASSQLPQSPTSISPSLNPSTRPPIPLAVDLHNAIAQQTRDRSRSNASGLSSIGNGSEDLSIQSSSPLGRLKGRRSPGHNRDRSDSGASNAIDSNVSLVAGVSDDQTSPTPPIEESSRPSQRPGILRGHNRTTSNGQSSNPMRALRFDSTSSGDRSRKDTVSCPLTAPARLKASNSNNSLTKIKTLDATSSEWSPSYSQKDVSLDSPIKNDGEVREEDDQDYGRPLQLLESKSVTDYDAAPPPLLLRHRGMSFGSSSETSLSPIFTSENATSDTMDALKTDFPFSINRPPTFMDDKARSDSVEDHLHVPESSDGRGRGDSLSSTSTSDSRNVPQYSTSGTTIGSGTSITLSTPGIGNSLMLPSSSKMITDEGRYTEQLAEQERSFDLEDGLTIPSFNPTITTTLNERRAHSPLDIDINLVSSHAQAEALVERTRRDILDLASVQEVVPVTSGSGPTPLSARLAAYGESLALERKLREKKSPTRERETELSPHSPRNRDVESLKNHPILEQPLRNGVERQLSFENKLGRTRIRTRGKDPRRPSTADGLSTRHVHNSFFPGEPSRSTHQSSLSVSPSGLGSTSFERRDFSSTHQRFGTVAAMASNQKFHEPLTAPAVSQTHVAEHDEETESLSRISSFDGVETETDSLPTVTRTSTVPLTSAELARGKREQTRASAKKLTRMGFSATDQVGRHPAAPSGKLFGGFKSIMQTFKGKS